MLPAAVLVIALAGTLPLIKTDPAVPVLTARAVATPVPSPLTPVVMGSPVKLVAIPDSGVPSTAPDGIVTVPVKVGEASGAFSVSNSLIAV